MIRVLVADDAEDLRFLIRLALEMDGRFEVVGDAADGIQTMEMIELEHPDVIVLDMAMPRMDGLQVLAEMKARGVDVKVLAFSGFDGGVEKEATGLGAADFVRKGDAPIEDLVPRLLAICA